MSEMTYETPPESALHVIDYENLSLSNGQVNVEDATLLAHVAHSIRLGHPQAKQQAPNADRVVLVGGGASIRAHEKDIVALVHAGAKLVTMNGSYHWCLERNLRPSAQVVLDARETNARFLDPPVPQCRYLLASQCHPATWAAVAGRPDVWIFHAAGPDSLLKALLDGYYLGHWHGVVGGTTVATRALALFRLLGYLRFDLFGVDSCWLGEEHHAFPQVENDHDKRVTVKVTAPGQAEGRTFVCSPAHLKQFEDFLQFVRVNGQHFLLNVHGDGMLAYAVRTGAADVTELSR